VVDVVAEQVERRDALHQPALGQPHALLALAWSHPYARVVAVIPAAECDASLAWLREREPLARVASLASACGRLFELTFESAERDRAPCAADGA
jgi:hypothetical protein